MGYREVFVNQNPCYFRTPIAVEKLVSPLEYFKMTTITIRNEDIRPLFLAVVYALSLPRKTIDRERLVNLQQQLQSDFSKATCTLNLEPEEILLLGGALNGVINEMKQFAIGEGKSMVESFATSMTICFPDTESDPGLAMDLVALPFGLKNRFQEYLSVAQTEIDTRTQTPDEASEPKNRWWKIW